MEYNIRKAVDKDAKELNKLLTELIKDEKQYDKNINENCIVNHLYEDLIPSEYNCILVAEIKDKIVGYIFGYIVDNGDAYLDTVLKLEALYVYPNYRNIGIGNSLILELKNWAILKNVKYLEVCVCRENEKAIKLYNKHNFNIIKNILSVELVKGE